MRHSRLVWYKTSHQPYSYFPVLSRPCLPLPSDHPGLKLGPDLLIAICSPQRTQNENHTNEKLSGYRLYHVMAPLAMFM
jgi:hypothetical protein